MGSSGRPQTVLEHCAVSAATAWGFYLMAKFVNHRWHILRLEKEAEKLQGLLDHERMERKAERQGRIRAEQDLHKAQYQMAAVAAASTSGQQQAGGSGGSAGPPQGGLSYPFRPIGTVQSCFSQRNGTPRQPLLVPLARCRIRLVSDVPGAVLSGLQQFSHVWVIYIFHENTDLVKVWQGDRSGLKAKVHVPRLNGEKMGVLATRSPHRPVPIGLSVAQVVSVEDNCIILGGADIVDGSPVLDIKPYLPFCDGVPGATAPSWVTVEAADEPLKVSKVDCLEPVADMVRSCWAGLSRGSSLFNSGQQFLNFVQQVLSRDIRPVHRRIPSAMWADVPPAPVNMYPGTDQQVGLYHVVLEHIDVSYDIDGEGRVLMRGACPNLVQSQQRGLGLLD